MSINATEAVKKLIVKIAEKKADSNCLGLMYEPKRPKHASVKTKK